LYEGTYQVQITSADLNNNWVTLAQVRLLLNEREERERIAN